MSDWAEERKRLADEWFTTVHVPVPDREAVPA